MKEKEIAAIILAAGEASRMGAFKPLLPFGNTTVIDYCVDNFKQAGIETVIVVAGYRAADIQSHFSNSSVRVAINPHQQSKMGESIAWGVKALPAATKAVLMTPADHPAVPSAVISALIDEWTNGARLVVPSWNDRGGHPVLVDLVFRDELLSLDAGRGLRGFLDSHQKQVTRFPVNSPYIARDMDTWDDYAALHMDVFGVLPPKSQDWHTAENQQH